MSDLPPVEGTGEWDEDLVEATAQATLVGEVRDVDPPEREALAAAMHRYGDGLLERLESEWVFKVIVRMDVEPHRRVFAMRRPTLADLAPFDPVFLGIPVAHLARKGSRLTLEGGRLVAPLASRRVVGLNEKGTQLFLYGRHLFGQSLMSVSGKPVAGDEVLVTEESSGRYLGFGIADVALKPLMHAAAARRDPRQVVVRNRADLGLYLRAQQGVPE